jgi:3-methyladenine DNA glycosylase AlkD
MAKTSITAELKKMADPCKAKVLQRFFKTGKGQYGEGDMFLGVTVPRQRMVAKKHWKDTSPSELSRLLESPIHEMRLTALLILIFQYQRSGATAQEKQRIYKFYLRHAARINNWDLVDLSAPGIVGAHLADKNKSRLYSLARSDNLWERRIAIVSTFKFIRQGQPQETLKIAKMLLKDRHELIHKAAGWMLREAGKRCGETLLKQFLEENHGHMPRIMLRYAIERLPEAERIKYLNMRKQQM